MWQVEGDMWHVTRDMCYVTCDMWYVNRDTWHMIFAKKWKNFMPKSCHKCRQISERRDFIVSVLLSAHVKRVGVSCMQYLVYNTWKCADNSTHITALYNWTLAVHYSTAEVHCTLPVHCISALYYCIVAVQSTTALYQCNLLLNCSSAIYYWIVAMQSTTEL